MSFEHEALLLQQKLSDEPVGFTFPESRKIEAPISLKKRKQSGSQEVILRSLLLESLISGSTAGALGIVFSQPLDVIRVRLQTNKDFYRTISRTARMTIASEGIKGLWKGVASPVLGAGALNALLFSGFEGSEYYLTNGHERESTMRDWLVSGSVAGIVSAFVTSPTELISRQAQVDCKSSGSFKDEADIARRIYQQSGLRGIFRGLGTTMARDAMAFTWYFCIYKHFTSENDSLARSFWAGGLAGSISWTMVYPLDILKTRWQVAAPGYFKSPSSLFRHSLHTEGSSFMFKGLAATILRAFPQHAVTFVSYECLKDYVDL